MESKKMDLFDSISRRKACRRYIDEALNEKELAEIMTVLNNFELLYLDIQLNYRFGTQTKGLFHVKAPHYLIISGQGKEGEEENTGFIGQQFMLWLNSQGLGGVWLGASKDATEDRSNFDIIVIAFGKPDGSPHRTSDGFKRKAISEITNDVDDECIKAAHLAPSGLNVQPWYFEKKDGKVLIYRQLLKPPISLGYKLTRIDMGIALSHYAVASRHYGGDFDFQPGGSGPQKRGYEFFGYINCSLNNISLDPGQN